MRDKDNNIKGRVLFISYHYPPGTAVGGLRMEKFTRHLPGFGWKPYVLTIKNRYRDKLDPTRDDDNEDVTVFKTAVFPGLRDIYLRVKKSVSKAKLAAPVPQLQGMDNNSSRHEGFRRRIKRIVISIFMMLPDSEKNWVIPAVAKALRIIKKYNIDCIITSSPPHSVQITGFIVKKLTGVKWVADFRDPWTEVLHYKPQGARSLLSEKIELWMEKKVLDGADGVLTTTVPLARLYQKRFFHEGDKFTCIPNGIDSASFLKLKNIRRYKKFTITYAGTLYAGRTPEPVFEAVKSLLREGRIEGKDICIKLMGNCDDIDGRPTMEVAAEYGLSDHVEVLPSVAYAEAIKEMRKSWLLLLFAPGLPLQVPAKLFDYLGAGTPILAITEPESATSQLLESTHGGRAFANDDLIGIKEFILEVMDGEDKAWQEPAASPLDAFDSRLLTGKLAEVLSGLARKKRLSYSSSNQKMAKK